MQILSTHEKRMHRKCPADTVFLKATENMIFPL